MKIKTFAILALCVTLAACASASPTPPPGADVAGFWSGLWHGLILPFSFIGSLFSNNIGIYETVNNGGWYNFGFVLGVGGLGGCACSSR